MHAHHLINIIKFHDELTSKYIKNGRFMKNIEFYREEYRPQFHFTAKENWLNDPNGLVYYKNEYHLFFQHNPKGLDWGPNTWGHAISTDLIHWQQIEHAIEPDEYGWIWSGSCTVDWKNTSGFKTGNEEVLIAIYTTGGYGEPRNPCVQSIAYSNDKGRTWIKYSKNPVLKHIVADNRDPKVIWHEPTNRWIMSLYLDGNDYALFSSTDLKKWKGESTIHLTNASECPDLFKLPVDGDIKNTKWVFWGANGNYLIGEFDGKRFNPESKVLKADLGKNFYAAQTWNDIPESDGRTIQIAWMAGGKYPNMPFNQQMSFPCELILKTTPQGIRLYRKPIDEIRLLYKKEYKWNDTVLKPNMDILSGISGELYDIETEIEVIKAEEIEFILRGEKISYSTAESKISLFDMSALMPINKNRIKLRIILDRNSIEIFGNDGQVSISSCFLPDLNDQRLDLRVNGGEARIVNMKIYELNSAWY